MAQQGHDQRRKLGQKKLNMGDIRLEAGQDLSQFKWRRGITRLQQGAKRSGRSITTVIGRSAISHSAAGKKAHIMPAAAQAIAQGKPGSARCPRLEKRNR